MVFWGRRSSGKVPKAEALPLAFSCSKMYNLREDKKKMKKDRFLTGILIGIALLIAAALVVFYLRKANLNYVSDDSPQNVVQNYVVAIQKKDYERAYSYLADLPNKPTAADFRHDFIFQYIPPVNSGLEIGDATINGEEAVVNLTMITRASDPLTSGINTTGEFARLLRQGGAWKIEQLPFDFFWGYSWYTPTPTPLTPVK
jgi:hypothetical protein